MLWRKVGNSFSKNINRNNDLVTDLCSLAKLHPDTVLIFDDSGKIVSENKKGYRAAFGFNPKHLNDFQHNLPEQTYRMLEAGLEQALNGQANKLSISFTSNTVKPHYFHVTFLPIQFDKGQAEGVFCIFENITERVELEKALHLKTKHLSNAQQVAKIASWEYLPDNDEFLFSDQIYPLLGIGKKDIQNLHDFDHFIHHDDLRKVKQFFEVLCNNKSSLSTEFRFFHGKTKKLHYLKMVAEPIPLDDDVHQWIGVVKDCTEQKELEQKLNSTMEYFRYMFNHLDASIWLMEYPSGKMKFVSKGTEDILQIPVNQLIDRPIQWEVFLHPDDADDYSARMKLVKDGQPQHLQTRIIAGDGTTKWIYKQVIPWFDENSNLTYLFGMMLDITERVKIREELDFRTTHDAVTGLPNQIQLQQSLEAHCRDGKTFALLYLHIDRLQIVHDALGYDIANKLLKELASWLKTMTPANGSLFYVDNHHLVFLLGNIQHKEDIFAFAKNVLDNTRLPFHIEGYEINVTTSIGISFFPENGDKPNILLEKARHALNRAKKLGKNNYQIFSDSIDISSYKQLALENDMRKALEQNQFELYYQPQVNMEGRIHSAEALVRWNHPDWGTVSPGEFIPLAEENHLIHDLTSWVIEEVCSQLKKWKTMEKPVKPIAINVSPLCLMRNGFIEKIKQILADYEISAHLIQLEITENTLLKDNEKIQSNLKMLKQLGLAIAIDDFGTGYSSLKYIHGFQVDILKLDKLFLKELAHDNEKDKAIVSSVIHLAKGLNIKIVAEGVERYEQYQFLKQKDCDFVQGYLFSKPVPLETWEEMMETGYLKPKKKMYMPRRKERRKFYRLEFPHSIKGEMTIVEVNNQKVNVGSTPILIQNLSLGGIKILSYLNLPVHSHFKYRFSFTLMGETFQIEGTLIWKEEVKRDAYYYGAAFRLQQQEEDRLAPLINQASTFLKMNQLLPQTDFIFENDYVYLQRLLSS